MTTPTANNFDLIRLVAALQVAVHHSATHLGVVHDDSWFFELSSLFPGVPIFFFVSGFLISKSFERNSQLADYVANRVLRIYPALFACFAVSLLSVYLTGYLGTAEFSVLEFGRWVVAQLTIGQFFNPGFMREYGVGVLNGSLWTIVVELQFYVIVPLLYALFMRWTGRARPSNTPLLLLIALFVIVNLMFVGAGNEYADAMWYKFAGVSFFPWLYMFLFGVVCQRNFAYLHSLLARKFAVVFLIYVVFALIARSELGWTFSNSINPLCYLLLSAVVFSAAFSCSGLSDRLLRRNDVSYGVYIYHMPVTNFLVYYGFGGTMPVLWVAIALSVLLAYASWRLIEKPALSLKRHPLYKHYAPVAIRHSDVRKKR